jgi:hypothetical protein
MGPALFLGLFLFSNFYFSIRFSGAALYALRGYRMIAGCCIGPSLLHRSAGQWSLLDDILAVGCVSLRILCSVCGPVTLHLGRDSALFKDFMPLPSRSQDFWKFALCGCFTFAFVVSTGN